MRTGNRIGKNLGQKFVDRIEESATLRQAAQHGDWVQRDEILMQRLGRRTNLVTKLTVWPWLASLWFGLPVFLAGTGLWLWWLYYMRTKITLIMANVPVAAAEFATDIRFAVSAACVTVYLMLFTYPMPTEAFWVVTAGGWLVTGFLGVLGWTKMTAYHATLAREELEAAREAEEALVDELPEDPNEITIEQSAAYAKRENERAFAEEERQTQELAKVVRTTTVYGFTKAIPNVFDVPEKFPAGIAHDDPLRFRHSYFIGKTGSGKSVFLRNVILQDIYAGKGVVILSHERVMFEDYILPYYPSERIDDLIYYNPADTRGKVVGFNIFALNRGENPAFKAGEIATVFERCLDDLGASMKPILHNAIDALVCMQTGKTLRDLKTLIDSDANRELVRQITASPHVEDDVKRFWVGYSDSAAARTGAQPLAHRLRPLLREPLLTTLSTESFNVSEEINHHQRVICLDLSELRGPQQRMVGQFLIALLRETFYARDVVCPDKNFLDYYWFIDEFQAYAGHSQEALLEVFTGLRKYHIGLTIAHQTKFSISNQLFHVIMGNVGTVGALRLQDDEARDFAKELRVYERRSATTKGKETVASVRAKYEEVYYLNVAGKSCPVPKHTEKQQIPRSHGFRDPEVVRVGRTHLPVAYPRSDLTSLRYPSPPRLRITGRLTPV